MLNLTNRRSCGIICIVTYGRAGRRNLPRTHGLHQIGSCDVAYLPPARKSVSMGQLTDRKIRRLSPTNNLVNDKLPGRTIFRTVTCLVPFSPVVMFVSWFSKPVKDSPSTAFCCSEAVLLLSMACWPVLSMQFTQSSEKTWITCR